MTKWIYFVMACIVGGFARYFVATNFYRKFGFGFPVGTLVINLSGCFLIGIFNSLTENKLGPTERLWLMTGFCGTFTTFSTFILETSNLVSAGEWGRGLVNVLASVVFGFFLFRAGELLGHHV